MTEVLYIAEYKHLRGLGLTKVEVRTILSSQYGKSIKYFIEVGKLADRMS